MNKDLTWKPARNSVSSSIRKSVWNAVYNPARVSVGNPIRTSVWNSIMQVVSTISVSTQEVFDE